MIKKLTRIGARLAMVVNRFTCAIAGHSWFLTNGHIACWRCGKIYKKVGG